MAEEAFRMFALMFSGLYSIVSIPLQFDLSHTIVCLNVYLDLFEIHFCNKIERKKKQIERTKRNDKIVFAK